MGDHDGAPKGAIMIDYQTITTEKVAVAHAAADQYEAAYRECLNLPSHVIIMDDTLDRLRHEAITLARALPAYA